VEVRDVVTGKLLAEAIFPGVKFGQMNLNRDGSFILCSTISKSNATSFTRSVSVWDVLTGKPAGPSITLSNIPVTIGVSGPLLSQNGKYLVTYEKHDAQIWDVRTGTKLRLLTHKGPITSACFSPGTKKLAIWGWTNISVWDPATGLACYPPLTHADALNDTSKVDYAEFSPDGSVLLTCQVENGLLKCQARLWNAVTGELKFELKHGDGVTSAAFSPDGSRIVTAGEDSKAIIWDTHTGRQFPRALYHEATVVAASFSPDGKWIVTASNDRTARVWNADTGDPLSPPLRHLIRPVDARFLADGNHIVTTDLNGIVRVWELPVDRRPIQDLRELAYLLSGGHAVSTINSSSTNSELLETIWPRLRSRYTSDFAASPRQVEVWHEFQASDCERNFDWLAQIFHLHRLLALHANDSELIERLKRANEHLKNGD